MDSSNSPRSASDEERVVHVELTHSGVRGHGEAAPIERYEESPESALAYVEEHADLLGDDPFAIEDVMARLPAREFAARAALDAALYDLQGKLAGKARAGLRVAVLAVGERPGFDVMDERRDGVRHHPTQVGILLDQRLAPLLLNYPGCGCHIACLYVNRSCSLYYLSSLLVSRNGMPNCRSNSRP